MNAFHIKVLAILLMIIDHVGLFFFPQFFWLRVIGRISFPLFAWLIANGAYHTHNIIKYIERLYLFALLSQIPFLLANRFIQPTFSDLNVLCTLFLGLFAIMVIQRTKNWLVWLLITIICGAIAQVLHTDYGGFGVGVVVLFYLFFRRYWLLVIIQALYFFLQFLISLSYGEVSFEFFGLFALLFIRFYNQQPGVRATYLFYIFYPLQYVGYYLLLLVTG